MPAKDRAVASGLSCVPEPVEQARCSALALGYDELGSAIRWTARCPSTAVTPLEREWWIVQYSGARPSVDLTRRWFASWWVFNPRLVTMDDLLLPGEQWTSDGKIEKKTDLPT